MEMFMCSNENTLANGELVKHKRKGETNLLEEVILSEQFFLDTPTMSNLLPGNCLILYSLCILISFVRGNLQIVKS